MLAALTTSIPESAESGRNWDYRHCWLRDSYFTVQALNRLGATRTMEGYLRFIDRVVAASGHGDMPPLFSLAGVHDVSERVEDALRGYRGMGPVRVGNDAHAQRQNDVYGAIVLAAAHSFFDERLINLGDAVQFEQLESLGEHALAAHATPDAGPWEFRGFQRVHTFSGGVDLSGGEKSINPETFSGDITIKLAQGASASVDFDSFSGSIKSDVPMSYRSSSRRHVSAEIGAGDA